MENNIQTTNGQQQTAPNAIASLVLGILSILSGCFGIGLVLGIIGAVLGSNGMKIYNANPSMYTGVGMLKAGKILSIIGIVFGGINVLISLIMLVSGAGFLAFYSDFLGLDMFDL